MNGELLENTVIPRPVRVGRGIAIGVMAVGLLVLVGWWSDVELLQAPVPGTRPMVPDTAIMFLLAGASLWLRAVPGRRWRRRIGRAAAALTAIAAAAFLLEYLLGIDPGMDRWLIATEPARPAVETASAFLLLGVALAVLDGQSRIARLFPQLAALVTGVGTLVVSIGYLYGYSYSLSPVEFSDTIGMAVHTSLALLALSVATLAIRPDRGIMAIVTSDWLGGALARRVLGVAAVTVPLIGVASVWLQHVGVFAAPGAAVLGTTFSLVVLLAAVAVSGRALDRIDAERARGEMELRHWKQFFDHAEFGAVFGSADGKLIRFNDAFARMHGWPADALVDRSVSEVVSAPARAVLPAQLAEVERRGVHRFESEHLRSDGSTFPVVVDATAVKDEAGTLIYRVAYVQDISEERRARVDQARLASLVDSSDDAIIAIDLAGVVVSWNRGAEALYGYAVGEILGHPIEVLYPPERAGERTDLLARLGRGEVLAGFETERLHKDGRRVPVALTLSPIVGPDGMIGVSAIARDVTPQRAAARQIARLLEAERLERARVESVLAQLPEGVLVLDAQGNLLHENPASIAYRDVDGAPQPYDVRWPTGERVPIEELPLHRAFARGEATQGVEMAVRTREGDTIPILVSAAPIRMGDQPVGAVAVFRDIRAIKDLERLREEWTSVIAHDLRQPLNGMLLAADLLATSHLPPEVAVWADRIRTGTRRLDVMIGDLLDASKLEARRLELRRTHVDLRDLVASALGGAPDLAARCDVRVGANVAPVLGDPVRILQVLGNLLSNAGKYGDPTARITLAIERTGDTAQLTLTNRGAGIPADEIPSLFGRFARTQAARGGGVEGTGLGLYICKGLVEAHGGRIWVESRLGETTSFHVTLPFAATTTDAAVPASAFVDPAPSRLSR